MALTDFLKIKDVRERFAQEFTKPKLKAKTQPIAPAKSTRYGQVGTAFDYLLRFVIKYHNPHAIERIWIATNALSISQITFELKAYPVINHKTHQISFMDENTDKPIPVTNSKLATQFINILNEAKELYNSYLQSGKMTESLVKSALKLAQLDTIFRTGGRYIDENLGTTHDADVKDLWSMVNLVKPNWFASKDICVLNPLFKASHLVGGADADLLIDDTLIEIKTVQKLELSREYFLQLVGYYVLYRIGGIKSVDVPRISKLGVYYSRYGELHTFPVSDIVNEETLPQFIGWMKTQAKEI